MACAASVIGLGSNWAPRTATRAGRDIGPNREVQSDHKESSETAVGRRYQRACGLISGQASNGPFGSPGFACVGKTGPPFRFHPLADLGRKTGLCHRSLLISVSSFVRAG